MLPTAFQRGGATPELIAKRNSLEQELQSIAIVDRKLMVPMRDGKRMATDVYRPARNGTAVTERLPVLLQRTPYDKGKAQANAESVGAKVQWVRANLAEHRIDIASSALTASTGQKPA